MLANVWDLIKTLLLGILPTLMFVGLVLFLVDHPQYAVATILTIVFLAFTLFFGVIIRITFGDWD